MTDTTEIPARPLKLAPPVPDDSVVSWKTSWESWKASLAVAGDITRFSAETVRELPTLRLYLSEILRQCGVLIMASAAIIWSMQFVIGTMCGTEASYTLKAIGAPLYTGVFTVYCGLREMCPYMFAYIVAAKIGCGLVAEIGSMRIAEEIDAMEVMGIRSRSYLVGTRLVAAWIAMPFLYSVGLAGMFLAEYLVCVIQYGTVSPGGYSLIFWLFQNPADYGFSMIKAVLMGTVIVLVGCYYGYTAKGGPVGVGINTAKSMMVNMVLVHVIGLLTTQLFWGMAPNAPIAN